MDNNEQIVQVDRRNMLARFFDNALAAKLKRFEDSHLPIQPFMGQHTSAKRQQKLAIMKARGIKTGKQFRKYIKEVRRQTKCKSISSTQRSMETSTT
jgi:hypothetical protein